MRLIKQLLLTAIILFTLSSCGTYYKLTKSTDADAKYQAALRYFYNKDFNKAVVLFSDIASVYERSNREDTIMFYMAKSLYANNMWNESAEMMKSFMYKYDRRSSFSEEAEYVYAMCYYNDSGTFERDQSTSINAIQAFTEYLNRYPESIKKDDVYEMINELTRKIYMKRYSNAAIYYKLGKYNAAITTLKSTLKQYPEIPFKEDIMYYICKSWYDYAENSIQGKQLDRYMKMMDAYYSYKGEFPENSARLNELEVMFNKAKQFTEEHGYQARAISKNRIDIEERLNRISEMKDRRFSAKGSEAKQKITKEIEQEREQLKAERKLISENKKEMKFQETQLKNQKKQEKKLGTSVKETENNESIENKEEKK